MPSSIQRLSSPYTETQVRAYLARIDFPSFSPSSSSSNESPAAALPPATFDTLAEIQWRHLVSIPFENTFAHYEKDAIGKAVSLKPEDLFERLVVQKKGCFCYGQASFLRDMLRALGFRCYTGGARVNDAKGSASSPSDQPPFNITSLTHMTIFVSLPTDPSSSSSSPDRESTTTYLVDVHFGKLAPTQPIPLLLPSSLKGPPPSLRQSGQEQHRLVRLTPSPPSQSEADEKAEDGNSSLTTNPKPDDVIRQAIPRPLWCLQHRSLALLPPSSSSQTKEETQTKEEREEEGWVVCYSFTEEEMFAPDYRMLCYAVATIPDSLFTSHLMISRHFLLPPLSESEEDGGGEKGGEGGGVVNAEGREFGRWTMFDWTIKMQGRDGKEVKEKERKLEEGDHEGRRKVLKEIWGIEVGP